MVVGFIKEQAQSRRIGSLVCHLLWDFGGNLLSDFGFGLRRRTTHEISCFSLHHSYIPYNLL